MLTGLKASQIKQLQRLYQQRISSDRLTTFDLAQRLAAISEDLKQPICIYINRRGQVIRVGVGTPRQTQIPPLELPRYGATRLSGIRCITTQLKSHPPTDESLTAMVIQRLDALVSITISGGGFEKRGGGATGYVTETYLAHLVADSPWKVCGPMSLDLMTHQDFLELVAELEKDFEAVFRSQQVDANQDRVIIVGVMTDKVDEEQFYNTLREVARLVETAGGEVLETLTQKRGRRDPQKVVGSGKVQEIAVVVQTIGANLIVFDSDLSPAQIRNLETEIGVRVIDRTELILDIFAQRARTQAGKLQVELAQLEYMLPRLIGRGQTMSRLGGGIGTRGPGETKLETERRAIAHRISRLQQEVNQIQAHRQRMRQQRQHQQVPSVAIVGYTNAGKSTLLNTLTNARVYTADQLFATLDPTTRRLVIPHAVTGEALAIVLTDTVGFIHELPPSLVDAFRATLEEVTEADALIHLVDLSHEAWHSQIRAVMKILSEMPISPGPALIVFNKIDEVDADRIRVAQEEFPQAIFISVIKREGLDLLRLKLSQLVYYATSS